MELQPAVLWPALKNSKVCLGADSSCGMDGELCRKVSGLRLQAIPESQSPAAVSRGALWGSRPHPHPQNPDPGPITRQEPSFPKAAIPVVSEGTPSGFPEVG